MATLAQHPVMTDQIIDQQGVLEGVLQLLTREKAVCDPGLSLLDSLVEMLCNEESGKRLTDDLFVVENVLTLLARIIEHQQP